jgi:hypothetical protein
MQEQKINFDKGAAIDGEPSTQDQKPYLFHSVFVHGSNLGHGNLVSLRFSRWQQLSNRGSRLQPLIEYSVYS